MPVDTVKSEVTAMAPRWNLVARAVEGVLLDPSWVKEYLPMPNPLDTSDENKVRYEQYVIRAIYYNFIRRSLEGFRGTILDKDPIQKIPEAILYVEDDIDGNGLSLEQYVRLVVGEILCKGRNGALVDMPQTNGKLTKKQAKEGNVRAYVTVYDAADIINDTDERFGSVNKTDLIVLRETYDKSEDKFEADPADQYRVLNLGIPTAEDAPETSTPIYFVEIWREGQVYETYYPKKSGNKFFDEIPFLFFGSENNTADMDFIPLEDMANVNVGHLRNSADYEESAFILGQPQVWATGITQHWVDNVWKGQVYFGSRAVMSGPQGSAFGLLQAAANTMAMGGMEHKEKTLVKLGARLVEPNTTQKTATQAEIDSASDNSVLSSIAKNTSDGVEQLLTWLTEMMGGTGTIQYELNREYGVQDAPPELINAWLKAMADRGMSLQTFLENMSQGNQLPQGVTADEELKRIEKENLSRAEDQIDGIDQRPGEDSKTDSESDSEGEGDSEGSRSQDDRGDSGSGD